MLKVIGFIYILHSLQWIIGAFLPQDGGINIAAGLFVYAGGASLITGILLLRNHRLAIPIAICRAAVGIGVAIYFNQFLNFEYLEPRNGGILGMFWLWPSAFFMISIIVLGLISLKKLQDS